MSMGEATGSEAPGSLPAWKFTLYGTAMAEYFLITLKTWVLKELAEIDQCC